jgi:hypothetical protein
MQNKIFTIGPFTQIIRGRNNSFNFDTVVAHKPAYTLALRALGWTPKQFAADYSTSTSKFKHYITSKENRRTIAAYLQTQTDKQMRAHVKSGALDFIACVGGTSVEHWVRVRANGYKAGSGWVRGGRTPVLSADKAKKSKRETRKRVRVATAGYFGTWTWKNNADFPNFLEDITLVLKQQRKANKTISYNDAIAHAMTLAGQARTARVYADCDPITVTK